MKMTKLAALALMTFMGTAALADNTMRIENAKAFATAPTAMTGGGFMTITNTGDQDDSLIGIRADFPRVELHTTEFADDVATMMHVDEIPIAAGETVTLEPGGLHVMFMGLRNNPLVEGETIPATLVFENAGEIDVSFDIVKREMAHSH